MEPHDPQASSEDQIRAVLDAWTAAIRAGDSAGLLSSLAQDALMFDLITPLQYIGAAAVKKRADEWLSSFQGPIGYNMHGLTIAAGEDVAFCHSLNEVNATKKDGKKIDMFWRATVCFRKIDGKWMATHEHSSVPFDMQTGMAVLDLKP